MFFRDGRISQSSFCAASKTFDVSLKTCRFGGGEAIFVKSEIGGGYSLYSISVDSPEYQTRRGLSPFDSVVRLIELYGFPYRTEDDIWMCDDGAYEYYRFTVENGIVLSINLHYSM
jgi:hypothetical protein